MFRRKFLGLLGLSPLSLLASKSIEAETEKEIEFEFYKTFEPQ